MPPPHCAESAGLLPVIVCFSAELIIREVCTMCEQVIKAGNRKGTSGPDKMPSSWSNNHNSKNA